MRLKHPFRFLVLPTLVIAAACSSGAPAPEPGSQQELASAVPDGKADDYLSPTSMEYKLWGEGALTLDDTWKDKTDLEKEAHAKELLAFKFKAYAHFINVFVTDKEGEEANADYGGFSGSVRSSSVGSEVQPTDASKLGWAFSWNLEMGGPRDIMTKLPVQATDNGQKYFVVKLPALDEAALVDATYPKDFDPGSYVGAMEDLKVQIEPIQASVDAWPDYNALFEDGKLDVLILIGGDYNEGRYDLQAAEEIFGWLKSDGFEHPAASYKDLTLESPPFTRTLRANGRDIAVEVSFLHADIVPDDKLPDLRQKIVEAYLSKDIVIYDGHAGENPSYSGVVYHYNPRHAISVNEMAQLALPSKYQIYLFNGCKTYSSYADGLYKSSTKTTKNLDVISTVNFSWLSMQPFVTSGFLSQLTALKSGTHEPRTFLELLKEINRSSNWNVYYGVHGLDDNPHVNPYADSAALCQSCTSDAQCPGMGNKCIRMGGSQGCGAECTADDGCPQGYACTKIATGNQIVGMQCAPKGQTCP